MRRLDRMLLCTDPMAEADATFPSDQRISTGQIFGPGLSDHPRAVAWTPAVDARKTPVAEASVPTGARPARTAHWIPRFADGLMAWHSWRLDAPNAVWLVDSEFSRPTGGDRQPSLARRAVGRLKPSSAWLGP